MSKKLFISLAPLVAIAALAVMPAGAMAAPHWYKNGSILKESPATAPLKVVSWGDLTLTSAAGEVTCDNAAGGTVENPEGGGSGQGVTQAFVPYNCTSPGCPAVAGFEARVIAEQLPWKTTEISEPSKELFRPVTGGIATRTQCENLSTKKLELNVVFTGEQTPEAKNGSAIGSKPSKDKFAGEVSGVFTSEIGPGTVSKEINIMGYNGGEIIAIHNP